ncbi:hypothetical protein CONPUDRAFT_139391 [Coniophora puteana RWD-64-598 SS2]|uniref:DUF7729 domain-containing protein n=1 Tax=Coniophora puteana (strain RWD-64-598) TaxID=741705 RepID=A0A5M3MCL4_CONPW|nr:uncharacterized protein CONPUDRAFT_139391 [Coniophora puteana RWD-64-598 SS2]EIW76644.1 hypothetical protein CONPUDRAFT_139391 [Coniophora puteana RWD-64-598 SS2]
MKSIAALTAFVALVAAQSSSSSAATPTSTSNPLIPSGISQGCSNYLSNLNSNSSFSACTAPIISATSAFAPGNTTATSSSAVGSALTALCAGDAFSSCPDSLIGSQLSDFYAACESELTSASNTDVLRTYDVLYVLTPLRQAVCAKSDSGSYCATQMPSSSSVNVDIAIGSGKSDLQNYLYVNAPLSRRDNPVSALIPNTTTFASSNLVYLFLEPIMSSSDLCTTCTRNILTPYISFESNRPYAPGLANSPLMSGQTDLYNAVQSTCGQSFLGGAVQAAGGISSGIGGGSNHAGRSATQNVGAAVAAILGASALALAL